METTKIIIKIENENIVFDISFSDDYLATLNDSDIENDHKIVFNPSENVLYGFAPNAYYSDDNYYFQSTSEIENFFGSAIANLITSELARRNFPTENFNSDDN